MRIETSYANLSKIEQELLDAAMDVMRNAYNPISHFYVGAAVLTTDGQMIGGANIENASYGVTLCAERAAIAAANALGKRLFTKIAIITSMENAPTLLPSWSCGACRQWLIEFSQLSGINLEVITSNTNKDVVWKANIDELLPQAFGPNDLGIDLAPYRK